MLEIKIKFMFSSRNLIMLKAKDLSSPTFSTSGWFGGLEHVPCFYQHATITHQNGSVAMVSVAMTTEIETIADHKKPVTFDLPWGLGR